MSSPVEHGWTRHGHAINGVPQHEDKKPNNVARCGGPRLCSQCAEDEKVAQNKHHGFTADPISEPVERVEGITFRCPRCDQQLLVVPLISNVQVKVEAGKTLTLVRFTPAQVEHDCPTTAINIHN